MGSGTTAAVAKALGRDYIGCELHEDYGNLIQKRVQEYNQFKKWHKSLALTSWILYNRRVNKGKTND